MLLRGIRNTTQLLRIVTYETKKSRMQNTPLLFRNPKLTPDGIVEKKPRSYLSQLPDHVPNKHLYWNRTIQNRISRKRYAASRLQKLGIRSIHENGQRTLDRSFNQILSQLANLRVIKNSLGRTLENLREALTRFTEESKGDDKGIIEYAMREVHERNLASMCEYQFFLYCYLRHLAGLPPSVSLLMTFYRFAQKSEYVQKDRIYFPNLAKICYYLFRHQYPDSYKNVIEQEEAEFKLFEDVKPVTRALQTILPNIYTESKLKQIAQDPSNSKFLRILALSNTPGTTALLKRIEGFRRIEGESVSS